MRKSKPIPLIILSLLILSLFCISCGEEKQAGEKNVAKNQQVKEPQPKLVLPDTATEPQELTRRNRNLEIERRLDMLLKMINEQEQSLTQKQQRLQNLEDSLQAVSRRLEARENRMDTLQTVAWVVLVIGVVSLVLAINYARTKKKIPEGGFWEMRSAYLEKMDEQFRRWESKVEELKKKSEKTKGDAKAEYNRQIKVLQQKMKTSRQKLEELKQSSESAWTDIKSGAEKAWEEMRKSLKDAESKFGSGKNKV